MTGSTDCLTSACGFILGAAHTSVLLYVDPGAGALTWQLLLASAVGALFYARAAWHKVRSLARRARPKGSDMRVGEGAAPDSGAETVTRP